MRLWIKPDQLAKRGINVTDITNAIQAQSKVNPAGQIGGEPASGNQQYTYALLAQGRLTSPEEFGSIVVREAPNGGVVPGENLVRVAVDPHDSITIMRVNGRPSANIVLYPLTGSNAPPTP